MKLRICSLIFLVAWLASSVLKAECPELERLLKPIVSELKTHVSGDKVVVVCRQVGKQKLDWAVHQALAVELSEALNGLGVDASPAAFDVRLESLGNSRIKFAQSDTRRLERTEFTTLVGLTLAVSANPDLTVSVFSSEGSSPKWTKSVKVPLNSLTIDANIPPTNRQMVDFCRDNFDRKVGSGICAQLATVGLEAVGAKRFGVYTWGRELDDQEPILPGDILQLELAQLKSPGFSRGFHHHTAVVENVTPDEIVVFHQNVRPKGEIVQRDTWPRESFKSGTIIAYRPRLVESPLAPVSPKRRTPATVQKRGSSIDLIRTLNPRLDSVRGIWFMEDNTLRANRDDAARLQIPIKVPDSYTLRMKVQRLYGRDMFGVGLVIDGRQTMICMDAYAGTVSGLHLVDGKTVKSNSTTYRGALLPENQPVTIRIRVEPDSVTAEADGKSFLNWKGNPEQLSQDDRYSVPRTDWLYLASWNTQFAISNLFLNEAK